MTEPRPKPPFLLQTPRLYLSHLSPTNDTHCNFIVTLHNTPEFLAFNDPHSAKDLKSGREVLTRRLPTNNPYGYGYYLISLKPSDKPEARLEECRPVGNVTLLSLPPPTGYTVPDLGFAMLSKYMGQGIATEAAKLLLDYVEREKGVKDIIGMTHPGNEASRKVFVKLGFVDCGIHVLKPFGGVEGRVFVRRGMGEVVGVYGI